jgi:hypothetical protein
VSLLEVASYSPECFNYKLSKEEVNLLPIDENDSLADLLCRCLKKGYDFTLGALALSPSDNCNAGVYVAA